MHFGGGDITITLDAPKTPALLAVKVETVILIFEEPFVTNLGQGLAHPRHVSPALAHGGLALLKKDVLFWSPEINLGDYVIKGYRFAGWSGGRWRLADQERYGRSRCR